MFEKEILNTIEAEIRNRVETELVPKIRDEAEKIARSIAADVAVRVTSWASVQYDGHKLTIEILDRTKELKRAA